MHTYANTHPVLRFVHASRMLPGLMLVLMLAASVLPFNTDQVQAAPAPPTVTGRVILNTTGLISIQGDGFTPGGRVQIVVVDHWGNALHEPVWTMAAPGAPFGDYGMYSGVTGYGDPGSIYLVIDLDATAIYGPNGSQDPANGYHAGVDVSTLIDAGSIKVRAFDEHANAWSGVAVVSTDSSLALGQTSPIHEDVPQACVATKFCQTPF